VKLLATTLLLSALATPVTAQWLRFPTPGIPRTADGKPNLAAPVPRSHDGHPDLSGLWTMTASGDLFSAADKVQPWLGTLMQQRAEDFGKDSPLFHCLPSGPASIAGGGMKRIMQTPALIAILNEDLSYRQIFMDGRALESEPNPSWTGYSVGRWDGDTLVVESAGFNDRSWLNNVGLSHTEALHVTERFRRSDFGHMDLDVAFSDAAAFKTPLHQSVKMTFASDTSLLENVCENPQGQQHWVGRVSDTQKTAVKVSEPTLAKYVGVYKGLWFATPRTVRVKLVDGALFVQVDDRPALIPIVAQSETLFEAAGAGGLGYLFVRDPQGTATAVIEQHVSGSYTYPRQP
jgi:hypothetical protein